jgi:hypothetical protein
MHATRSPIPKARVREAKPGLMVLLAAALLVVLAGLVIYSKLIATDAVGPSPDVVQAPAREKHDVAVLSADFDPPLSKVGNKQPALLVVVDNRGTETEAGLIVHARLAAENPADVKLQLRERVASLAPGEVKVVRFGDLAGLPRNPSYWLTVEVVSAQSEANFVSSLKTLRVDGLAAPEGD